MKVILVGLGSAGFGWYKKLIGRSELNVAIVEQNVKMKEKLEEKELPYYTDLSRAIEQEKPDFIVNVTSPQAHTVVNNMAFDYKIPVLCEKPISFDYEESVQIVDRARREHIPFMIAENYRCLPYIRKLKQMLRENRIGSISSIDITFYRYHHSHRNFLLDDIAIHHFDMVRYLTGSEGKSVFAKKSNPSGGWAEEDGNLALYVYLEMADGVSVTYSGSIASRATPTPWAGNWRIEGTEGAMELVNNQIKVLKESQLIIVSDFSEVHAPDCLTEFISSLKENRPGETSGEDYLKTQALVHYANKSHQLNRMIDIG